jgi:hypothetical protein
MSQKTNPVALRLQSSNKHFESCWYSDIFYHQVLSDEAQLRTYIASVFYQAGHSKILPSLQSQYRRYCTLLFLLDTRGERHKREYSLKLSREPVQEVLSPKLKFLSNKNKPRICVSTILDGSLLEVLRGLHQESLESLSQDKFCRRSLSQDTRSRTKLCLVSPLKDKDLELDTKQKIPTQNTPKEYVYNYAIKGSYLESLPFSEVVSAGSSEKSFLQSPFLQKKRNKVWSIAYNSTLNPELKHSHNSSNRSNHSYKKVKSFLSFSISSLALVRSTPYKEAGSIKAFTLSVKRGVERLRRNEAQLEFGMDVVSKIQNTAFLKAKITKSSTRKIFTVKSPKSLQSTLYENLFRRLIIDRSSQSTQNRLSYLSKSFVSLTKTSGSKALFFEKIKTSDKTGLKNNTTAKSFPVKREKTSWHRHTELFINLYYGTFGFATLYPVRAISPLQSAGFLIESVAYLLQRKSSFRQIKDDIFRELERLRRSQLIKGMRLSCAGRLGGRSKKAQKAKTQSAQWGETSLTVFSSRLAFASKGVSTAYGKVGVKIWLCYSN